VNRIALHQSVVYPMDPVAQVGVARAAGMDSIGLRVAAVDDEQAWWAKGLGSPMLHELIAALLASRVTVLDVGRVELGPELHVVDGRHAYVRALEIGVRLGAQYVTARAGTGDPRELFGVLTDLAARYQLRALLTAVPGTEVDTLDRAVEIVTGTRAGVVLDVSPLDDPDEVADTVARLGDLLGYVRVPAAAIEAVPAPAGLLATLPPQVAVAIGTAPGESPTAAGPVDADHAARVAHLRARVDAMLRHPQSSAIG
jgi:hypothetical protein